MKPQVIRLATAMANRFDVGYCMTDCTTREVHEARYLAERLKDFMHENRLYSVKEVNVNKFSAWNIKRDQLIYGGIN